MFGNDFGMNIAYLILGGNLGNRAANIRKAEILLEQRGVLITDSSPVYETAPWNMENCADFLNKVIQVTTKKSAHELLETCLKIEEEFGRLRDQGKYLSRAIDLDILFFNKEIVNTPQLTLPHPRLHERKFVLTPLEAIAPDFFHPILKKNIRELLRECPDKLEVRPLIP